MTVRHSPGSSRTRRNPRSSRTGRATVASSSRTYSWTTSSPGRGAGVRDVDPDRHRVAGRRRASGRSTRSRSIVKDVYERPNPNGQSGDDRPVDVVDLPVRAAAGGVVAVGERDLADVRAGRDRQPAARARRRRRGRPRSPPARPRRGPTPAGTAAQCSAAHARASGRPLTTTRTVGVRSRRRPRAAPADDRAGRVHGGRANSPVVASSVRPDRSPSTTIATSASRAAATASASSSSVPSRRPVPRAWTTRAPPNRASDAPTGSSA